MVWASCVSEPLCDLRDSLAAVVIKERSLHVVHFEQVFEVLIMKLELPLAVLQAGKILFSLAVVVFFLVKSRLISKLLDKVCGSNPYKRWFANLMNKQSPPKNTIDPAIINLFAEQYKKIGDKAMEVGGDVLEIGAGTAKYIDLLNLPEESSLVVVDYNPFMEKHFRESLAKAPHIKLKDYLVQSAADMSNIPDNTFAVVYIIDVMCSLEIEDLRMMLKEIKRVLKPGGYLFFMEHVLDVQGTWRRTFQKFVSSQLGIWPRLFGNCHCDRETWRYIQEAGFSRVNMKYLYLPKDKLPNVFVKGIIFFIRRFLIGHAKK